MKSRGFEPPMTSSTTELRSDPGAEPYRIRPPPGIDDLCDEDDVEEDDWYMTSIAKWREIKREIDRNMQLQSWFCKEKIRCFFMG